MNLDKLTEDEINYINDMYSAVHIDTACGQLIRIRLDLSPRVTIIAVQTNYNFALMKLKGQDILPVPEVGAEIEHKI